MARERLTCLCWVALGIGTAAGELPDRVAAAGPKDQSSGFGSAESAGALRHVPLGMPCASDLSALGT